jgi:hypothetical protein
MAWKIRNWNEIYEDHKSRKLKKLPWYPEPSSDDTYSYAELLHLPNGPAVYGVWSLLKKVAAAAPFPHRGILLKGQSQPHTIRSLAILTRTSESVIDEAIKALLCPEIAWLEEIDFPGTTAKPVPAQPQIQTKEVAPVVYLDEVAERICAKHPKAKTMSVQACGKALEKIIEDAIEPAKWLKHIEKHHAWRVDNEWTDCEPRYVKTLAKWLSEDPMAPIPDSPKERREEPDYVERF